MKLSELTEDGVGPHLALQPRVNVDFPPVYREEMALTLAGNSSTAGSISSTPTNLRNVATRDAVRGFWTKACTE